MPKKDKKLIETPIELSESDVEYEVEAIKDKRINDGKIEYLIKWAKYKDDESTWEPIENLENSKELIEEYENKINQKIIKLKTVSKTIKNDFISPNKLRIPLSKINMNNSVENIKKKIEKDKEKKRKVEFLEKFFLYKKRKIEGDNNLLPKLPFSYKELIELYYNSKPNNLNNSVENKKNIINEIIQVDSFSLNLNDKNKMKENKIQEKENEANLKFPSDKYELIEIINCCKKDNDIILCVSAKDKETSKIEFFDLFSNDVADINPKLLINYYESNLSFSFENENSQ